MGGSFWSKTLDAFGVNQTTRAPESATQSADKASSQAAAQTDSKKRAVARSRTINTSPLGLKIEATTYKKTLLGQ
jgi:hypothetical protein